jgi:hypothetical protein
MRRAVGILSTAIVPLFVASMAFAADPYGSEGGTAHEHGTTAGMAAGFMGEHTMTGRITDIDKDMGRVKVNAEGQALDLHFPKTALQNLNKGDQVTVSLGIKPSGSTAGTRGTSGAGAGMPSPRGTGDYPATGH